MAHINICASTLINHSVQKSIRYIYIYINPEQTNLSDHPAGQFFH